MGHPTITSSGAQSSNLLQWLDFKKGYHDRWIVVPLMSTRVTYPIISWPRNNVIQNGHMKSHEILQHWIVTTILCPAKRGQVKYIDIQWNLEKKLISPILIKMLDVARNPAMQFPSYCLFNVSIYSSETCLPEPTQTRGTFHKLFFHHDSNSMEIQFRSPPNCNEVIAIKFCT